MRESFEVRVFYPLAGADAAVQLREPKMNQPYSRGAGEDPGTIV